MHLNIANPTVTKICTPILYRLEIELISNTHARVVPTGESENPTM